ncbi:hypothetical protein E2C01_013074 [Portunus trituberculatus]|uniref:Uncharacterized protein n=1 Tax=Portunus trituberculatus TaxID=210409 RepID=A0A5B7DFZ0_PORTR|nr:hypothetical protein [Portunus trituberculatus]
MRALGSEGGLQAHGFESCPRSKCRLGFLTRGNGFLTRRRKVTRFLIYLMYDFVLDNMGAGSSRDVKHEIDVFGDPDGWIQDNAQKRKKMSDYLL